MSAEIRGGERHSPTFTARVDVIERSDTYVDVGRKSHLAEEIVEPR
jgi:hypothetical protein